MAGTAGTDAREPMRTPVRDASSPLRGSGDKPGAARATPPSPTLPPETAWGEREPCAVSQRSSDIVLPRRQRIHSRVGDGALTTALSPRSGHRAVVAAISIARGDGGNHSGTRPLTATCPVVSPPITFPAP